MLDPITKEKTKQKVELTDVYKEFEEVISTEIGVDEFRSKRVTKNFAYHPIGVDVPEVCEYIEVIFLFFFEPSLQHTFSSNRFTTLERKDHPTQKPNTIL